MTGERLTVDELVEAFYLVACRWNGCELPEEERRALRGLTPEEVDAWCATPRDEIEAAMWEALETWAAEQQVSA